MLQLYTSTTHPGDTQPDVRVPLRVPAANLVFLGFVGVKVYILVPKRRAAGHDYVVEFTIVEHLQRPDALIPLVEGEAQPDNVLGYLERVCYAASIALTRAVDDIPVARPPRVGGNVVVPSVVRYTAVRAAAGARRPRVVRTGAHVDPGPVASDSILYCYFTQDSCTQASIHL